MYNNEQQDFEVLDILVLISFYIQMDDHNESRKEFKYLHEHLESIETKLNLLLERGQPNGEQDRK